MVYVEVGITQITLKRKKFYVDEVQFISFFFFVVHTFDVIFKKLLPHPR